MEQRNEQFDGYGRFQRPVRNQDKSRDDRKRRLRERKRYDDDYNNV